MKNLNYLKYKTVSAIPEASSMIEAFRAIGYNIQTAVADIIDNSISANAKNVWINFKWLGSKTWLSIKDDGFGMNNQELIQAMKPGSKNPSRSRTNDDLGRFGLGLKTASFSQARKLTVISKKKDLNSVYWTWDLNFVNHTRKWKLLNYIPNKEFETEIAKLESGTIVIWNEIDRIVRNSNIQDTKKLRKFLEYMDQVKKHLAMVFHKFIESGSLSIFFQGKLITPWNPFLISQSSTQIFPIEKIHNGNVKIEGYVLPHKSKLSSTQFKEADGIKGWNEHQGFYLYRNDRLILAGDWLGLFRKEEHYKLSRIQIELPNTLDSEWQIDIKKSIARPPSIYKGQIKAYATKIRSQALNVYRHKGKSVRPIVGQKFVPLWIQHKRGNKWFYKINRESPLIKQINKDANHNPEKAIEKLMRFIEETIPAKSIYINESEQSDEQGSSFEKSDQQIIKRTIQDMFSNLKNEGKTNEEAISIIANIEPFNNFTHLLGLSQL